MTIGAARRWLNMAPPRILRLAMVVALTLTALVSALPPGSTAAPATAVPVTWKTTKRMLDDGRTYFVRAPHCDPADRRCDDYLAQKRTVAFFLHAAGAAEDRTTAASWLQGLDGFGPGTIFVYAVSADHTKRFDAGFCCTEEPVDDIGYLTRVIGDIGTTWAVDREGVGAIGLSNGGMLALRAACERPDVFSAVSGLAATYPDACDVGKVRIGQWHGADDPTVPLNGGTVDLLGQTRDIPPVASLAQRMVKGSVFQLRVIPHRGHSMTWGDFRRATHWMLDNLPG